MKKITVTEEYSSQRLDKYLKRLLPACPGSLLYKQLRKKNITLNGSKADGSESVKTGDTVEIFFSDETFEKFSAGEKTDTSRYSKAFKTLHIDVVSESDDYLIFNKPAGVLSQSDKSGDLSVNDYLTGYLLDKRFITRQVVNTFPVLLHQVTVVCDNLENLRIFHIFLLCRQSGLLPALFFVQEKYNIYFCK